MILILTSESDRTSRRIIDWLDFHNADYIRFSNSSVLRISNVQISTEQVDATLHINDKQVKISDIGIFWYRRSYFTPKKSTLDIFEEALNKEINKQLNSEHNTLTRYILDTLRQKSLNHPDDIYINKLTVLAKAIDFGIKIPSSSIVNTKRDLVDFYNRHNGKIITKNFSQGVFISFDGRFKPAFTLEVTEEMIDALDNEFHEIFLQENIEKVYELRIFYLGGTFYSSAIFSQSDDQTKVDFRNYNHVKPNRVIPYQLDEHRSRQLKAFLDELQLNSCSLDILIDSKGDHYFLEINPIGQFAQVSNPCNYNLEKKVANYLIKKDTYEVDRRV